MTDRKKYHPLLILYDLWDFVKNTFIVILLLFVINYNSESFIFKYGRIVFLIFTAFSIIYIILRWFTAKYEISDTAFHLYKGVFTKSEQTIPFTKIENANRRTKLFHRIFKVTSIQFETGIAGDSGTVEFEVISIEEADQMEQYLANQVSDEEEILEEDSSINTSNKKNSERVIHFNPTKKDVIKASFTSLSFLFLVPVIGSIYYKVAQVFNVEEKAEGLFTSLLGSWWVITILVIILIIASAIFGITRAYLKYGKYEIASDEKRIYITQGVLSETSFSISKENVQAIEINQSLLKRLFGLAEVRLISVGNLDIDGEVELNSLYPFLPIDRATELISELLPAYEVTEGMTHLPKKSLWIRMFKPSWVWIITSLGIAYFQPSVFEIEQAWWMIIVLLFIVIYIVRILDYIHTRYILNGRFIQIKKGSITTSLFITKREKIVEINVTRNIFQQWLGLSSIEFINRAKPVHHTDMDDVPLDLAATFYTWYAGRRDEVEIE